MTNEEISIQLYREIPGDQMNAVFGQERCDIDATFMGFVKKYKNLSEIIPRHYTVLDFGCAYNPQSFLFKDHKQFIAIDYCPDMVVFQAPGTEFSRSSAQEFIENRIDQFDLDETFAICSYLPDYEARELVRKTFKNVFVFYPSNKKQFEGLRL